MELEPSVRIAEKRQRTTKEFYVSYSTLKQFPFSALTPLVGWQEGHPACRKTGMLVCWWWWFDWSFARLTCTAPV